MHKAIYLDNDVVYIDEMNLSKSIIIQTSPPLLQLFSFIFTEIKKELQEFDTIPDKAFELSDIFKETYLQSDTSLFGSEEMLNQNIGIMKEVLEEVEINTVYKDDDYWHFFDAVESFLYSEKSEEDGVYWGISNFYDIWEDMCQTYFLNKEPFKNNALFADIKGRLVDFGKLGTNPFEISLNKEQTKRNLKPDLVIRKVIENVKSSISFEEIFHEHLHPNRRFVTIKLLNEDYKELYYEFWKKLIPYYNEKNIKYPENSAQIYHGSYKKVKEEILKRIVSKHSEIGMETDEKCLQIIDYKYMAELAFHNYNEYSIDIDGENKINDDIKKQLIYEWAVQNSVQDIKTESEFWIPYYDDQHPEELTKKYIGINNIKFNESQIKVVKMPFNVMQDFYLKNWLND